MNLTHIVEPLRALARPIAELIEDPRNARRHPEVNLAAIRASLAKFGQQKPVVLAADGRLIIAGNGTVVVAREMGWTHIAAVQSHLSGADATAYGLADNRSAETAQWDYERVGVLIAELDSADYQLDCLGWSPDDLDALMKQNEQAIRALVDSAAQQIQPDADDDAGITRDDDDTEDEAGEGEPSSAQSDAEKAAVLARVAVTIAEPKAQVHTGQVWRLGPHMLVCDSVITAWPKWAALLEPGTMFCPYAGPFVLLSDKARAGRILVVQPDRYIAGHIIDRYAEVFGAAAELVARP